MLLDELLEMNYSSRKDRGKLTTIDEVYGIIYRIYCIPEDKSYIGQTYSHQKRDWYYRWGIINRCKDHYKHAKNGEFPNRPLFKVLNTYPPDQFEVTEVKRIKGKELAHINQIEGEYMKEYKSLHPHGYNLEEVGKRYSKILLELADHYGFEIERHNYEDTTRERRGKDVCIGVRFGKPRSFFDRQTILSLMQTVEVEQVRLMKTSGGTRLIAKEKGTKDNIRIYFNGTDEEAEKFASQICPKVVCSPTFRNNAYKYQLKLEKALKLDDVRKIKGKMYLNKSNGVQTYVVFIYGKTNFKLSIGGKRQSIEKSYEQAVEFVNRFSAEYPNQIKETELVNVCNRETEKVATP